jgi:hypothetical protein
MAVDEQMNDLILQKRAAQWAVQDHKAQHKSVEAILQEFEDNMRYLFARFWGRVPDQ